MTTPEQDPDWSLGVTILNDQVDHDSPDGAQEILNEWNRRMNRLMRVLQEYDLANVRTLGEHNQQTGELKLAMNQLIELKQYQSSAKAFLVRRIETSASPYRVVAK